MTGRPERRDLALRAGVAVGAAVTASTFARGLLPRSTTDQAMATAVTAAFGLGAGTLAVSAIEASAELLQTTRGWGSPEETTLATACLLAAAGLAVSRVLPDSHETPLPVATASSAARILGSGSLAAALVVASDMLLRPVVGRRGPAVGIGTAAALGGAIAAARVRSMERRADRIGETGDISPVQQPTSAAGLARSAGAEQRSEPGC